MLVTREERYEMVEAQEVDMLATRLETLERLRVGSVGVGVQGVVFQVNEQINQIERGKIHGNRREKTVNRALSSHLRLVVAKAQASTAEARQKSQVQARRRGRLKVKSQLKQGERAKKVAKALAEAALAKVALGFTLAGCGQGKKRNSNAPYNNRVDCLARLRLRPPPYFRRWKLFGHVARMHTQSASPSRIRTQRFPCSSTGSMRCYKTWVSTIWAPPCTTNWPTTIRARGVHSNVL